MSILHEVITSDHRPLALTVSCPKLPMLEESGGGDFRSSKVNWHKITPDQKHSYSFLCKKLLSEIELPSTVIECKDLQCNSEDHIKLIEYFYNDIIFATQSASDATLITDKRFIKHCILCWNKQVKEAHSEARISYLNWINQSKPNEGVWYDLMKSKLKYLKLPFENAKLTTTSRRQMLLQLH